MRHSCHVARASAMPGLHLTPHCCLCMQYNDDERERGREGGRGGGGGGGLEVGRGS